jgi:hypothetical protein
MMFAYCCPFLDTREQTRDVITRDKPTKCAAVKERHKTAVAGALLLHLLCQNVISSGDEGSSQPEGPVTAFGLHNVCFLLESRV